MSEVKERKRVKARRIVGIVFLIIFVAAAVIGAIYHDDLHSTNSWFKSNPTQIGFVNVLLSWVPTLVITAQILAVTMIVLYLLAIVYSRVFRGTPRRVTIGKLVGSISTVIIWVVSVLFILAEWGFNVGALIASAGVLTLVIGLGMQSLIADVVAGIFIVCDGTLQVGDVVTIEEWRGTVQEIGIRNTKLINYSGDIRVTNNSQIKTFINQSRVRSCPTTTISITYEEDIERVEKLFQENIEKIRERLPLATEGPYYWGVKALSDSSVDLLFAAYCDENDFYQVQRDLNRALRIFFMEQGIAIPFPQMDVHFDAPKKG